VLTTIFQNPKFSPFFLNSVVSDCWISPSFPNMLDQSRDGHLIQMDWHSMACCYLSRFNIQWKWSDPWLWLDICWIILLFVTLRIDACLNFSAGVGWAVGRLAFCVFSHPLASPSHSLSWCPIKTFGYYCFYDTIFALTLRLPFNYIDLSQSNQRSLFGLSESTSLPIGVIFPYI